MPAVRLFELQVSQDVVVLLFLSLDSTCCAIEQTEPTLITSNDLYTGCIKKKVIELCSALARSLYNLQKSFFRRRKDQAFSFRLSSFL